MDYTQIRVIYTDHIYGMTEGGQLMSLNRAMIIGNLGQDPEIRYTPSGLPVVNFSLATDERYLDKDGKRQEGVQWHRIVVIGKLALACNEYLKKGREVFVEGRLRTREWENNGSNVQHTEIVASRVQFLGTPPAERTEANPTDDSALPADSEVPI
jgi:single-strand DNA-binding protein